MRVREQAENDVAIDLAQMRTSSRR